MISRDRCTGFGDPADDLNVATIIFLISGRLVLLRPRRAASQEVKYDLQLLSSSIEFFWTAHLSGIGTLENSLWGWDGKKVRVWLDALTIEKVRVDRKRDAYESVNESVGIDLDFYPLGEQNLSSQICLSGTIRSSVRMSFYHSCANGERNHRWSRSGDQFKKNSRFRSLPNYHHRMFRLLSIAASSC